MLCSTVKPKPPCLYGERNVPGIRKCTVSYGTLDYNFRYSRDPVNLGTVNRSFATLGCFSICGRTVVHRFIIFLLEFKLYAPSLSAQLSNYPVLKTACFHLSHS